MSSVAIRELRKNAAVLVGSSQSLTKSESFERNGAAAALGGDGAVLSLCGMTLCGVGK